MSIDRREFLKVTAAVSAGTLVTAACTSVTTTSTASATSTTSTATPDDTAARFKRCLETNGYSAAPSAPLVTGHEYNGGLQYTGAGISAQPEVNGSAPRVKQYVSQQVARMEDMAKKNSPGTLPIFSMIGPELASRADEDACAAVILNFLVTEMALAPASLRVTTTDRAKHFFPILAQYGITESQIRLRPWDEAKRDGGGSGHFAPKGHPRGPAFDSFSIECMLSDGTDLEIAEFLFGGATRVTVGVIGVERVTMARNDRTMAWNDRLAAFKIAVEADAKRQNLPLPPGYYEVLGIAKPA